MKHAKHVQMIQQKSPERVADHSSNTGHPNKYKGAAWVDKTVSQHQILKYLIENKDKIVLYGEN